MSNKGNAVAIGGAVVLVGLGVLLYKAYQKGRKTGHAEGYQQAKQYYEPEIQTLRNTISSKDNIITQKDEEIRQKDVQISVRDAEINELKEELKRISKK